METPHLDVLQHFTETTLPDLDVVVLGALELFSVIKVPKINFKEFSRPLVIGSGNAVPTERLIFEGEIATFADLNNYQHVLEHGQGSYEDVVIVSASGKKHSVQMAHEFRKIGAPVWLFTNNPEAPAATFLDQDKVKVFPKNREPYTYNTSTYMSMLISRSAENPSAIHAHIREHIAPIIRNDFASFDAFYFILPTELYGLNEMFLTKFDELFGAKVSARVFTLEQSKHAKTVIPSDKELFISFGEDNQTYGTPEQRFHVPLPEDVGIAGMMAIGYYIIGHIQKQHPPYFKENIAAYMEKASALFGQELSVIVE